MIPRETFDPKDIAPPEEGRLMQSLFAVIRSRGPAWDASRSMDGQDGWAAHAEFMNGLRDDGFVLLGGPLEGTADVLLIIRAYGPAQIEACLARDPWTANDLLRITRILPWRLRLGSLGPGPA